MLYNGFQLIWKPYIVLIAQGNILTNSQPHRAIKIPCSANVFFIDDYTHDKWRFRPKSFKQLNSIVTGLVVTDDKFVW